MRDHLSPIFYSGTGVILRSPQTELNVSAASSLSLSLSSPNASIHGMHTYTYIVDVSSERIATVGVISYGDRHGRENLVRSHVFLRNERVARPIATDRSI